MVPLGNAAEGAVTGEGKQQGGGGGGREPTGCWSLLRPLCMDRFTPSPPTPFPPLFFVQMEERARDYAVPVLSPHRWPHAGARDHAYTLSLNAFGHPQLFCIGQRNVAANG